MDLTTIAALVFAVCAAAVVAFQLALALGAPWGRYAMGGAVQGRFPPPMRIAAVVQGVLIALLAVVVLSAAGLMLPDLAASLPWLVWVAVVVSALAVVLNAISRSAGERRIWVPVASVLLVSSLVVALGL
jgi:cytochrome bd-type quinol oxidase subunit 2